MSPDTLEETKRTVRQVFASHLQQSIGQRAVAGRPLIIDLSREMAIHRSVGPQVTRSPTGLAAQPAISGLQRRLAVFPQLLRISIMEALKTAGPLDACASLVPFLALHACGLASRLMEQMGVQDPAVLNYDRRPPELEMLSRESFSAATTATALAATCETRVVEGLRRQLSTYAKEQSHSVAAIRLCAEEMGVRVEGLTGAGDHVFGLPLEDFIASFLAPAMETVVEEMLRKRPLWERRRETGMVMLKEVCPDLADALNLAKQEARPVGIRLCTGHSRRGHLLDVWFFVDSGTARLQGGCVLAVNRPHRDFILESSDGSRYYFPPCLLSARFTFLQQMAHVEHPIVRQPAGGYHWCHPYTGRLGVGVLSGAHLLHHEGEIMYAPSDQALKLLPRFERIETPLENNLCLSGQERTMHTVQEMLRSSKPAEADVLAAVTALHDVARLGLTRGHQDNGSGPRARLDSRVMPYPLAEPHVEGLLTKRTFPFRSQGPLGRSASSVPPLPLGQRPAPRGGTTLPLSSTRGMRDATEVARILKDLQAMREARR